MGREFLIMQRRREEGRRQFYSEVAAAEQRKSMVASWESTALAKQASLDVRREYEALREKSKANMEAKRDRLADLLAGENAAYLAELKAPRETPAERQKRIVEAALKAREEREKERLQFAETQNERRFVEGSDELRAIRSKKVAHETSRDLRAQMAEKSGEKEELAVEKKFFDEEYAAARLAAEKSATEERERKKKDKQTVWSDVRGQVESQEAKRLREKETAQREFEREMALLERDKEEEKQLEEGKLEEKGKRRTLMLEHQERVRRQKEEDHAVDRLRDQEMVKEMMMKEREAAAADREKKEREREEHQKHRTELEVQMAAEAEDEGIVDRAFREEEEKMWRKREETWNAESAAREKLKTETLKGRHQQLDERMMARDRERTAYLREREELEAHLHDKDAEEELRAQKKKAQEKKVTEALRVQVARKDGTRRKLLEEKVLEAEEAKKTSADYEERLRKCAARL